MSDTFREAVSDTADGRTILAAAPLATWGDAELHVPLAAIPCGRVRFPLLPYPVAGELP